MTQNAASATRGVLTPAEVEQLLTEWFGDWTDDSDVGRLLMFYRKVFRLFSDAVIQGAARE